MLNAREARKLTDSSPVNSILLREIENIIKVEIQKGKNSVSVLTHKVPEVIEEKLKNLGYGIRHYTEIHHNYVLISW